MTIPINNAYKDQANKAYKEPLKFCVNCKHAGPMGMPLMCDHPDAPVSLVTGLPSSACEDQRTGTNYNPTRITLCGQEGARWEITKP